MSKKIRQLGQLFFPLILGGIVSILIKDKIDYGFLLKPPLAPMKIIFPIVWSIIYLVLGISYYKLNRNKNIKALEKGVYYTQLVINALWSIIFFFFKLRLLACLWIVLLDLCIIYMIYLFIKQDKISGLINIPYLLWCLFATYLTVGIYLLN